MITQKQKTFGLASIFICLVMLLTIVGCTNPSNNKTTSNQSVLPKITKKATNNPKPTIVSHKSYDFDNDNLTDTYVYTYAPVKMKRPNVEIQRIVIVGQYSTSLRHMRLEPLPSETQEKVELHMWFKTQISSLTKEAKDAQDKCSTTIGLNTLTLCSNESSCASACDVNGSLFCRQHANDQSYVGFWILQYVNTIKDLGENFNAVSHDVTSFGTFVSSQQQILLKLNEILDDIDRVESNPIMFNNTFSICSKINYKPKKILELMDNLATFQRVPTLYRYAVIIKVKSLTKTNGSTATTINLRDKFPMELITKGTKIFIQKGQTASNATKEVDSNIKLTPGQVYYFTYEIISPMKPTNRLLNHWKTPEVLLK